MAGVKGRSGGHNAKTVSEHRLVGTFQKVRHAGIRNPVAPAGRPKPPLKLTGEALAEWNRMCARLESAGVLAQIDDAAIYQASCHFAETEDLARLRDETGASIDMLEENLGHIEKSDLTACFQEITKLRQLEAGYTTKIRQGRVVMKAFLVEFGLTPASRGRVKLPEQKPQDEWDEFDGTVQ